MPGCPPHSSSINAEQGVAKLRRSRTNRRLTQVHQEQELKTKTDEQETLVESALLKHMRIDESHLSSVSLNVISSARGRLREELPASGMPNAEQLTRVLGTHVAHTVTEKRASAVAASHEAAGVGQEVPAPLPPPLLMCQGLKPTPPQVAPSLASSQSVRVVGATATAAAWRSGLCKGGCANRCWSAHHCCYQRT